MISPCSVLLRRKDPLLCILHAKVIDYILSNSEIKTIDNKLSSTKLNLDEGRRSVLALLDLLIITKCYNFHHLQYPKTRLRMLSR